MVGCTTGPPTRRGPTGGLRLRCEPTEASVYIDEEFRGPCRLLGARPLPLAPGTHRLQVEARGYFPYYGEIETGGVIQTLEVPLVQRPD